MKKRTKTAIAAIAMILIFGLSSITYIVFSLDFIKPENNQQEQQQDDFTIEEYVYYEPLTNFRKQELVSRGYTIATANYKTGCCQDSIALIQQLPQTFQQQVVVELLQAEENSFTTSSLVGAFSGDIESKEDITATVCKASLSPPPDCGIILINQQNSTQ